MSRSKYNTKKLDEKNITALQLASTQITNLLKDIEKNSFSKIISTNQGPNFNKLSVLAEIYNNLDASFNKSLDQCKSLGRDLLENYKKLENDLLLPADSPKKLPPMQLNETILAINSKQKFLKIKFIKYLEHQEQLVITKDFYEDLSKLPGNIDYGYLEFQKIIKQIQTNYESKAYEELKHKKFSEELFKTRKDNAYTYLGQSEHKLGFFEKLKRWLGFAKSERVKARKTLELVRDKQYIPSPLPAIVIDKALSSFSIIQTNLESFSAKIKVATSIQSAFRQRLAKKKLEEIKSEYNRIDGKIKEAKLAQVTKLKRLIYEEYMTRYFVGMVLAHSDKITLQQNRMATLLGLLGIAADQAGTMGAGRILARVAEDIIQNNRQQQAIDFAAFIENNRRTLSVEEIAQAVANIAAYNLQNSLDNVNIAELAKEFSHRASNNLVEIKKEFRETASLTPKNFLKQYAQSLFNFSSSAGDQNIEHARNLQRLNEYRILRNPNRLSNNYKTQIDLNEIKKIQVTPDKHNLNVNAILFEIYKQSKGQLMLDPNLALQGAQALTTTATQSIGLSNRNISNAMKPLLNEFLAKRLNEEGFIPEIYNEEQLKSFISKQDIESMLTKLTKIKAPISLDQAIANANQPLTENDFNIVAVLNNIQEQSRNILQFSSMKNELAKLVKKKLEKYQYPVESLDSNEWKKFATKDDIDMVVSIQINAMKYKGNISVSEAIAIGREQITETELNVEGILDALKNQSGQALKRKPMRKALEDLVARKLKKAEIIIDKSNPHEWKKFTSKQDIEQMLLTLKKVNKFSALLSLETAIETSISPAEIDSKEQRSKLVKKLFPSFKSYKLEFSDSSSTSSDGHTDSSDSSSNESMAEKVNKRRMADTFARKEIN